MEKLVEYFKPTNYQLSLQINKHQETLRGTCIITGEQLAPVIKLHAVGLKVTSVSVNEKPIAFRQEFGLLVIDLGDGAISDLPFSGSIFSRENTIGSDPVTTGVATGAREGKTESATTTIEIKYHTRLNRNMQGAYLSTYQHAGAEERIVTTQFESHYARECFPCIDEPAAKATFDLKITTPDLDDEVISNMPIKESKIVEHPTVDIDLNISGTAKKKIVTFEQTPKMSTYLLAFVMGRFHKKTIKSDSGLPVTTYCALNQDPKTLNFANQIAADAIEYYNSKFGVKYPLPKLDQVALPDFEAGAMENWGLVTYRESCLLADDNSPLDSKEGIAITITHELSHQWFGNLVTMKWWDDLWLNESFATVMSYICTDAIHPEYHIWQDFFTSECLAALTRDAYPGVQAVKQEVNDPAEIATLFDASIVYAKGAHLMFMLIRLMGKRQFFAGIKKYFKDYQYKNTVGDDLWASLQPHADFDVREFMDTWISQPGYPVITDGVQQRFLITGGTDESTWPLPEIKDDMSGHYLINLSGTEFADALGSFKNLKEEQRYRLLIDRLLLSETSLVSAASLLDLLQAFKDEKDKTIWDLLSTIINKLKIFCPYGSPEYNNYQKFVYSIIRSNLDRLGIKPKSSDKVNDVKLRPTILAYALYSKDQLTIDNLSNRYNSDYKKLDAETRYAVLAAKLETTIEEIFDEYVSAYSDTAEPDLRADLLAAFSDVERPTTVKKVLKLLESPEIVRPQDHIYLFAYLVRNHATKDQALDWLYTHWDYVKDLTGEKTLDDYIRISARVIRTKAEADKYFTFFDPLSNEPAFTRSIAVAHQEINARLHWLDLDEKAVSTRLADLTQG